MPSEPFVHLRVRSGYSLLTGALRPDELVKLAAADGQPAVAMTDHANMFGALEFAQVAAKTGVQPIHGCLLPLLIDDGQPRRSLPDDDLPQILLLAQNETGYGHLLALQTAAYLSEGREQVAVTLDDLAAHSDGVLALSGMLDGPLARPLQRGQDEQAEVILGALKAIFAGRLYIEIQRHGLDGQAALEEAMIALAFAHDLPLVATNDVRFADDSMFAPHDALMCIAESAIVTQDERTRVSPEHRFKSAEDMCALFADLPEAIANTAVIARRCAYLSPARDPILPPFDTAGGRNEAQELRAQAEEGLEERLEHVVYLEAARARDVDMADLDVDTRAEIAAPYRKRLAFELDVIEQMKFPGYFLIVSDFIKWAKGQGIPVGPGRGSGAGSVAAWSLHITDLDPLRFGLLFERFLNPERVSMPDFDIDFCQDRRDEVIRYVQRKYGRDKVAAIITFGKLQARAALRDVGRVLGMPFGQVDRICKLVPFNPAKPPTIAQALEMEPRLAEERKADEQVDRMVEIALKLEGLPRHASTHAAGVVIGDRPLDQLVPLYRDPRSDMPVTQFNMKDVEKAGLVKFDFLGLTTLTMLRHAEELVNQRGTRLVLSALPLDNQAAYALLARGETAGVFQLESGGMRDALRKLKPDRFEDLIAMVSLYRPGPMENIPVYTDVKHGKEQASYLHPKLEPILKETNGVIIYQEQVMQIARDLAGYSLGGADILRRAMGKKIKEEMDKQRGVFVKGAVERNIEEGLANTIFDLIAKFASYGFNKSHAAAYALLAYQTAYLKANHTVEFFAASMTLEKDSQDKLVLFRAELADAGIALLPPDVNASGVDFEVEDTADGAAIRYALSAIRGVGSGAMALLVEERQSNGLYRDVCDLVARLGTRVLNKRLLEGLVRAGALDSLHDNRRQLNDHLDVLLRYAAAVAGAKASEQDSLFAGSADADVPTPRLAPVADWPSLERLGHEFTALGFYMSAHPLDGYRALLQRRGVVTYARLAAHIEANPGAAVHLAGVVLSKQERSGQRGRYAFVRLSDTTGAFEVAVFSEVLSGARDLLDGATPLLVHADVRQDEGNLRIMALGIEPLDLSASRHSGTLEVTVAPETDLDRLFAMLAEATEQACGPRVCLVVPTGGQEETALELPDEVVLPFASRPDLERLPGVVRVRDL